MRLGGLEGRLGDQVCVLVEVIEGDERGSRNVNDRPWCSEREETDSTMGEAEIVRGPECGSIATG
jgi:hypothetical protein